MIRAIATATHSTARSKLRRRCGPNRNAKIRNANIVQSVLQTTRIAPTTVAAEKKKTMSRIARIVIDVLVPDGEEMPSEATLAPLVDGGDVLSVYVIDLTPKVEDAVQVFPRNCS